MCLILEKKPGFLLERVELRIATTVYKGLSQKFASSYGHVFDCPELLIFYEHHLLLYRCSSLNFQY